MVSAPLIEAQSASISGSIPLISTKKKQSPFGGCFFCFEMAENR